MAGTTAYGLSPAVSAAVEATSGPEARFSHGDAVMEVESVADAAAVRRHCAEWKALGRVALRGNPVVDAVMTEAALTRLLKPRSGVRATMVWRQLPGTRLLTGVFVWRLSALRWGLPIPAAVPWAHQFNFGSAPLIHPDHARDTLAAFFAWLDTQGGPPLVIDKLPLSGALFEVLEEYLISTGRRFRLFDRHERALLATGADADAWLRDALPAKKRKELRRQRRRLDEMGGLTFESLRDGDDVAAWCTDFMTLEAAGWKGRRGSPLGRDPRLARFVHEALEAENRDGNLGFWKLMLGGRPVAMTFAVRRPPAAWLLKIAHDESLARFSPGVQLMLEVSRCLVEDGEVEWVDSCADAGHPMIDHLWRQRLPVADVLIAGRRGDFGMLCGLEAARRLALRQARRVYHFIREGVQR